MMNEEYQEIEMNTKYLVEPNGNVRHVLDLGINEKGKNEFIEVRDIFTLKNFELFETKRDAMYHKLIKELKSGKPLSNFKGSKYYSYYLKRLKKEHPEYAI